MEPKKKRIRRSPKKRLFSLISSRLFIIILLLLFQFVFLLLALYSLGSARYWISTALTMISFVVVLWILSKNDNPSFKMAWIILIMAVPLVGGLFYLMFGNKHIGPRLRRQISEYSQILVQKNENPDRQQRENSKQLRQKNPMQARQADYIYNMSLSPLCRGTKTQYFPQGEQFFQSLLAELKKAKEFILLEYFIIQEGVLWNQVLEILTQKIRKGVKVYLIYDDMGCINTLPNQYDQTLEKLGISLCIFNPFRPRLTASSNYRDHRKICVIDGIVGFTGGINLADEYINEVERYGHWKDSAVLLRGEALRNLTEMFVQIWQFSSKQELQLSLPSPAQTYPDDGFVQPFGDSPLDTLNVSENAYMQMINQAKDYIYITTPYLVLDNEMASALELAAQSGIDLRIMTPHIPDKWYVHAVTQSFYKRLLLAGARIYEYTPGFVHAKTFVCDDETAIVGTTNMDFRSFYLHFECGVAFYHSSVVGEVKRDFLRTQQICTEITLETEQQTSLATKILRSLLKAFSPLM